MMVHDLNGRQIMFAKDICEHLEIDTNRLQRYLIRGYVPQPDGIALAPHRGHPGRHSRFWYMETIRAWQATPEYARASMPIVYYEELKTYEVDDIVSAPQVNLGDMLTALMSSDQQDDYD